MAVAAARIGATVLVEPVSGPKPYPLRTAADAAAVVTDIPEAGHDNVGLLLDLFHLAALADRGYDGWVGLECNPTTTTEDSLAWLDRARASRSVRSSS